MSSCPSLQQQTLGELLLHMCCRIEWKLTDQCILPLSVPSCLGFWPWESFTFSLHRFMDFLGFNSISRKRFILLVGNKTWCIPHPLSKYYWKFSIGTGGSQMDILKASAWFLTRRSTETRNQKQIIAQQYNWGVKKMVGLHWENNKRKSAPKISNGSTSKLIFALSLPGLVGIYLVKKEEIRCEEKLVIFCDYSHCLPLHLWSITQGPYNKSNSCSLNARISERKRVCMFVRKCE